MEHSISNELLDKEEGGSSSLASYPLAPAHTLGKAASRGRRRRDIMFIMSFDVCDC
jgi:hypothetical protein